MAVECNKDPCCFYRKNWVCLWVRPFSSFSASLSSHLPRKQIRCHFVILVWSFSQMLPLLKDLEGQMPASTAESIRKYNLISQNHGHLPDTSHRRGGSHVGFVLGRNGTEHKQVSSCQKIASLIQSLKWKIWTNRYSMALKHFRHRILSLQHLWAKSAVGASQNDTWWHRVLPEQGALG